MRIINIKNRSLSPSTNQNRSQSTNKKKKKSIASHNIINNIKNSPNQKNSIMSKLKTKLLTTIMNLKRKAS